MTFTHQRWRSRRRLHLPIMQRNVIMSTITAHRTYGADRCCSVDAMREKRLQLIFLGTPVSLQACCLLRSASAMQAPERIEDFFSRVLRVPISCLQFYDMREFLSR